MKDVLVHFLLNYAEEEYLEIYPEEKIPIQKFIKWLHKRITGEVKEHEG